MKGAVLLDVLLSLAVGMGVGLVSAAVLPQGAERAAAITLGEGLVFAITSVGVTATFFLWKRQDGMARAQHEFEVRVAGEIGGLKQAAVDVERRVGELQRDINGLGSKLSDRWGGEIFRLQERVEKQDGRIDALAGLRRRPEETGS